MTILNSKTDFKWGSNRKIKRVTKEDHDMSECRDLVENDQAGYERDRYENQTEDRGSHYSGNY